MAIRRVVRVLVYQGPPEWVENTLKQSWVGDGAMQTFPGPSSIRAAVIDDITVDIDRDLDNLNVYTLVNNLQARRGGI